MKALASALLLFVPVALFAEEATPKFDAKTAERFASLALACVAKEYPNKISHLLNSDADVAPPPRRTRDQPSHWNRNDASNDTGHSSHGDADQQRVRKRPATEKRSPAFESPRPRQQGRIEPRAAE